MHIYEILDASFAALNSIELRMNFEIFLEKYEDIYFFKKNYHSISKEILVICMQSSHSNPSLTGNCFAYLLVYQLKSCELSFVKRVYWLHIFAIEKHAKFHKILTVMS